MNMEKAELTIIEPTETSPAAVIQNAISTGADLDKLEKLLALQERWESNEARKAYHKSMAQFKANPPRILKDRTVSYKQTQYTHASLANVVATISAELSKYGLSASWNTKQNGEIVVTCRITHELGHFEETSLSAGADNSGSKNSIQAIGSTITYLERYTLLALTGLAAHDMDDDGIVTEDIEYITVDQQTEINDLIAETETNKEKFLDWANVESVEKILMKHYAATIKPLKAKQEAKNANS